MKNVFDIRYEKELSFILPKQCANGNILTNEVKEKTAVILYLYYEDTVEHYFQYIKEVPELITIYIISSSEKVLEIVRQFCDTLPRNNVIYILKENRGRDISALLVEGKSIICKYKYVCFLHDKKRHAPANEEETLLWIENLWGNLLGSKNYIELILGKFEENENIGVLVPPDPIGDNFCTWYGLGWHGSFEITKRVAEELHLKADLDEDKPPITIGTALWFRTDALEKLFAKNWVYEDFEDAELANSNYLSYGIERIFAYVAQDAGYDAGEIMTLEYAQKQNNYLHYSTAKIFGVMQNYFPLVSVSNLECFKKNLPRLLEYARNKNDIYLYGAGKMGRFCLTVLRDNNIEPKAFIVTKIDKQCKLDGLKIYELLSLIEELQNASIIITVVNPEMQIQIVNELKKLGIEDHIIFIDYSQAK